METSKQRTERLMAMTHAQLMMHCQDLTAERDKLKAALDAATAFIDCHVADPDITAEMRIKYAKYQKALKESA